MERYLPVIKLLDLASCMLGELSPATPLSTTQPRAGVWLHPERTTTSTQLTLGVCPQGSLTESGDHAPLLRGNADAKNKEPTQLAASPSEVEVPR